jgi:hypothetical protein
MKIIKVIYDNGKEKEVGVIIPLGILKTDEISEKYKKTRVYQRQFNDFEKSILDDLSDDVIKDYAEWNLDLIKEEDSDISDFNDDELLEEIQERKLTPKILHGSIINETFMIRFKKIIECENALILDKILTEFECKLHL